MNGRTGKMRSIGLTNAFLIKEKNEVRTFEVVTDLTCIKNLIQYFPVMLLVFMNWCNFPL